MTSACELGSAVRKNTFSSKLDVNASHTTPREMSPTPIMLNLLLFTGGPGGSALEPRRTLSLLVERHMGAGGGGIREEFSIPQCEEDDSHHQYSGGGILRQLVAPPLCSCPL